MRLTNTYNLPQSFVDVINKLTYDITTSDPNRLGVTTLINPPRTRILSVRHWKEMEEDVSNHIWRVTGNAYHYVLSNIKDEKNKSRMVEEKITQEVDGMTVVGKMDLYDADAGFSVEDYKITSVWSLSFGDKEDWIKQLNCYAWLLRKKDIRVDKAYINAILRDWRKNEVFKYNDYPKIPFIRKEIPLWTFEEQEDFVNERVIIYKDAMPLADDELPICSATERWQKQTKFAVYKNQNKTASRVLDTDESAKKWIKANVKAKDEARVVERTGVDLKCTEYCTVNKFCSFWKENYGKK